MFKVVFWHWWALAAVLLVLEMTLPGVVFLFLAVGATVAGFALLAGPGMGLEWQLGVFAVVAAASAVVLKPLLRQLLDRNAARTINDRTESLVLDSPIIGGRGRVKIGDGSWSVVGPDMAAGFKVRVVKAEGAELTVEPAP